MQYIKMYINSIKRYISFYCYARRNIIVRRRRMYIMFLWYNTTMSIQIIKLLYQVKSYISWTPEISPNSYKMDKLNCQADMINQKKRNTQENVEKSTYYSPVFARHTVNKNTSSILQALFCVNTSMHQTNSKRNFIKQLLGPFQEQTENCWLNIGAIRSNTTKRTLRIYCDA